MLGAKLRNSMGIEANWWCSEETQVEVVWSCGEERK